MILHPITMCAGAVIGGAVGASLAALLTVIIVITVVYLLRRSRYRHYQLHQITMSMSRLDDDESRDQLIT